MVKVLKLFFFLSAGLVFFAIYFHSNHEFDQDLGRHMLLGKMIWTTGSVPKVNLFSYTYSDFPFINTHWLSEVLFYLASLTVGVGSLTIINSLLMVGVLGSLLVTSFRLTKNIFGVAFALIIFTPVLLERSEVRPETFSYLYTSLFMIISLFYLNRFRAFGKSKFSNLIFVLPIIQLFWVNSHVYFFLGPVIWLVTLFSLLAYDFLHSGKIDWSIYRKPLIVELLILIATLFNPMGLTGAIYPFRVFDNYGYAISENQNIFFLESILFNPNILYFKIAFIVYALSYFVRKYTLSPLTIITVLLFPLSFMSFMAIRSFPFFFLINFVAFAINIASIHPKLIDLASKNFAKYLRILPVTILSLAIAINLVRFYRLATNDYLISIENSHKFGNAVIKRGEKGIDFVIANNLKGPIFNNFDVGGYLDYRLYPKEKVFVDNRPEAYPSDFFLKVYYPMQANKDNFDIVTKLYDFKLVIYDHLDHDENFLNMLIHHDSWQLVYLDNYLTVFVRKDIYPEIANKFAINESSFSYTSSNYYDYITLARASSLFGWNSKTEEFLLKAYNLNPNSLSALNALGSAYSNNPAKTFMGKKMLDQYRQNSSTIWF